jgi:hypothetical protein
LRLRRDRPVVAPTGGAHIAVGVLLENERCYALPVATVDRSAYLVRKLHLAEEGVNDDVRGLSPSARVAMVWQLTVQTWAFKEGRWSEPRLRRDLVRTLRGRR